MKHENEDESFYRESKWFFTDSPFLKWLIKRNTLTRKRRKNKMSTLLAFIGLCVVISGLTVGHIQWTLLGVILFVVGSIVNNLTKEK